MLKIIAFSVYFYSRMPKINLSGNGAWILNLVKYFYKSEYYIDFIRILKISVDVFSVRM
ncbi:hypothetical protein NEICINOT_04452 [Neisseria cinerea ATCC 14685]|uniref:Uncharacterized protein n=1 Tax=Neisseria cinerea ATCC 14685 TaxID=546262 RepID=D0W460_NEICI|nr:hypothetical protein NEICINOT_04452 [Neisseria cinerea ATCC 14685]